MRRSAAPSQLQAAKRTKFAAPFKVPLASPTTLERNECKSSLQPSQNCNENLPEQELHAGGVHNIKTQRLCRKFLPPSILHKKSPPEVKKIIVEERMASVSHPASSVSHVAPSAKMSDCNVDSRTGHGNAVNSTGEICTEPDACVISKTEFDLIPKTVIAEKLDHCDSSFSCKLVTNPNAGQLKCLYSNLSCNSFDEEDPFVCLQSHVNMSEMEDKEKLKLNYQKANSCLKRFHSPLTKINKSASQSLLKLNTATSSGQDICQKSAHYISQDRKDMSTGSVRSNYFSVVWGKLSKKKHKKWEGDGVLLTTERQVILYDMDGREIGKGSGYKGSDLESLAEGETLVIGGKEIEVMSKMMEEQFRSGKCFSGVGSLTQEVCQPRLPNSANGQFKPFISPTGCLDRTEASFRGRNIAPKFDPCALDALVMPRPSPAHQQLYNKHNAPVVDVVVDPHLNNQLRLHQREGVVFLYECVMGLRNYAGTGAILADDMGLGKTLQCITLIWTLLKQGMYGGRPPVKRVLIISPGSLVKNWCMEFRKWLGPERMQVYGVSGDSRVEEYTKTEVYPVLIISYEMFVRSFEILQDIRFDLVVCDEGHRLKNSAIKTTSFISKLDTMKRIILSGTPVQNDLQEFFAVVDFCNPGILGTSVAFRHVYEEPIMLSRQPGASIKDKELGRERAAELSRLTRMFVLRRNQEVNNKYLPPKVELVLFCLPSALQVSIYRAVLRSKIVRSCLAGRGSSAGVGSGASHLAAIAALKQLCNHPQLLLPKVLAATGEDTEKGDVCSHSDLFSGLSSLYNDITSSEGIMTEHSGKLATLNVILKNIYAASPHEKVVLVSNHTKTLDLLQQFCTSCGYQHARLDGQTPTAQRQEIVTRFNSPYSQQRIFLLSSKAGGVGLNLIGASQLFLYDIDWNPANDLQAMARIWRDGQKKEVHIYRLLTTGTLEEKIYQRQICKQGLSGAVIDLKASNIQFSQEELLDLFSFREDTLCDTHSLLGCPCDDDKDVEHVNTLQTSTFKQTSYNYHLTMAELLDWQHVRGSSPSLQQNWCLQGSENVVSFLFWQRTQPSMS